MDELDYDRLKSLEEEEEEEEGDDMQYPEYGEDEGEEDQFERQGGKNAAKSPKGKDNNESQAFVKRDERLKCQQYVSIESHAVQPLSVAKKIYI